MIREVQNTLLWTGEVATQVTSKALLLVHRRLLAEASTAAWQDYLLFNALLALVAIIPALLVNSRLWRRARPAPSSSQAVETPAQHQTQTASKRQTPS
jgi:hypothetical protein